MNVIYFDGYCNLCNGFIDFLIRHDHKRSLRYAPLQGARAHARLPQSLVEGDLATMVFEVESGAVWTESTAALMALAMLGGAFSIFSWLRVIPRPLRDVIYRMVARHRHWLTGRRSTCRLPTAEERTLFLDE